MRRLVPPVLLFATLCGLAGGGRSQVGLPLPVGINTFVWTKGSPAPTVGGVDVAVDVGPAAGWKCTDVTLRVVDAKTNKTLGEFNQANPPAAVSKSFAGLGRTVGVRVTAEAVFQNNGQFDVKQIQTQVTTK